MADLKKFEDFEYNEEEDDDAVQFKEGDKVVYLRPGYKHDNEVGTIRRIRKDGRYSILLDDDTHFAASAEYVFPSSKKRKVKKNDRHYNYYDDCGQGGGGCGGGYGPVDYGGCGGGGNNNHC